MALTRRALKAMGIDEEKIDEIIALHTETVDGLKADIEKYKQAAEEEDQIKEDLEAAKAELETEKKKGWKEKYDALKTEYDSYKSATEEKATHEAKKGAYRELLKQAGVSDKRINSILKVSDIDGIELDEKGTVKGAEKLVSGIKSEWSDFIVSDQTQGANTATPPANNQGTTQRTGRAAKIAAQYHDSLYGSTKGENNK